MFEIEGLKELQAELSEASTAFGDADGEFGTVRFDPHDPASIEAAIAEVERLVDDKFGRSARNSLVGPVAAELKAAYRQDILDRAAAVRAGVDAGERNDA